MNEIGFFLNDYYDMLNLHKALLEAKFHQEPDNVYISGSPIIANIYNELLNKLTKSEYEIKGKESWTEWRKIKNQKFYEERAINNINCYSQWKSLDYTQKINVIYNYFSPFTYTEEELSDLIVKIDCSIV